MALIHALDQFTGTEVVCCGEKVHTSMGLQNRATDFWYWDNSHERLTNTEDPGHPEEIIFLS